jgi:valyl-tRNA synthetase
MADAIYHFVWGTFCDWYVELVKPLLSPSHSGEGTARDNGSGVGEPSEAPRPHPNPSPEGEGVQETRRVAAWAFDQILVMLHPLMPFITEELWHAMGERKRDLIVSEWPEPQAQVDPHAKRELEWLIELVSEIRTGRTELNVPPGAKPPLVVEQTTESTLSRLQKYTASIERLARCVYLPTATGGYVPGGSMQFSVGDTNFVVPLEGVIDVDAEKARLERNAVSAEKERDTLEARLLNPNFTERAKPEAVEKARADHEAKAAEADRLRAALERLG